MRFFSVFTSLLAASFAAGMATPNVVEKRALSGASALAIVQNLNSQLTPIAGSINQTLAGINSGSTPAAKAAAAQKVNQQLASIVAAMSQAVSNVTSQANSGAPHKRAASDDSGAIIAAIVDGLQILETVLLNVLNSLGLAPVASQIMQILGTINPLLFGIAAFVVDDVLPNIGPAIALATAIINLITKFA